MGAGAADRTRHAITPERFQAVDCARSLAHSLNVAEASHEVFTAIHEGGRDPPSYAAVICLMLVAVHVVPGELLGLTEDLTIASITF